MTKKDCFCSKTYQCLACEKAERAQRVVIPRPPSNPRKVAQCGTRAGYNKHLRLGEVTCDDCRQAQTVAVMRIQKATVARKKNKELALHG
jgi:hypothetical protein